MPLSAVAELEVVRRFLPHSVRSAVFILAVLASLIASGVAPAAELPPREIPVTTAEDSPSKGILLYLPKAISTPHAGKEFTFNYGVINTLEEKIFFQTEPVELIAATYTHPDGSRAGGRMSATGGPHFDRYALLDGSDYRSGERISSCCSSCSRRGRVELPEFAKPGGTVTLTVYVGGYFMRSGERFTGKTEVTIPVIE
jgi:hypothetical protein